MACNEGLVVLIAYSVYMFIILIMVSVVVILKLLNNKLIVKIMVGIHLTGGILLMVCIICCALKDCLRETRQNTARQRVDVEQPRTTRVQIESVRAPRQPYRSTLPPPFQMRALPPSWKVFRGECAICMDEFKKGDIIQPFGVCVHKFHSSCIQRWFKTRKTTCPICREDLSTVLKTKRAHGSD